MHICKLVIYERFPPARQGPATQGTHSRIMNLIDSLRCGRAIKLGAGRNPPGTIGEKRKSGYASGVTISHSSTALEHRHIFNGLRPGSAAPTHLRISARDERKHAICRQTQTDTKRQRQTRKGSSRTRRQTQTDPDRHKETQTDTQGQGGSSRTRRQMQIRRQT